jgi:predicted amino acid-binding ACT domain protein
MRTRLRQTASRPARKDADSKTPATPFASVESIIHTIRSERVILDADLARLYGVPTKVFNQAVRRNRDKFPPDFLLELTSVEAELLRRSRSQIVTLKRGSNVKFAPFAFTEHGAIMAANILNSPQAVQMSVFVVRVFVKMRSLLTDTRELAKKLAALEKELTSRLDSHETAISEFMRHIMLLLDPPRGPETPDKEMGFHTGLPPARR